MASASRHKPDTRSTVSLGDDHDPSVTITVEGLGPFVDLATAIGIVGSDGQFDSSWFANPGDHVSGMLRNGPQRDALLRAANQLLEHGAPPIDDSAQRRWVQVFADGGVSVNIVIGRAGTTTEIGIGARLTTDDPHSETEVYVPLLHLPDTGTVSIPFADGSGTISVSSEITLDPNPPAAGQLGLRGLRASASIATNGTAPSLAVSLLGLQLPGQTTPSDVSLGDLSQLEEQAIRLLFGLIQHSLENAVGELSELLALVGITDDTAIPELPIVGMIEQGGSAWRTWLDDLLASSAAMTAWLIHLRDVVGHNAVLDVAAAPGMPSRISWSLPGNGLAFAAVIVAGRTAAGAPFIELGTEVRLGTAGPPEGAIELSATFARITLGESPKVEGLPVLELAARLGPSTISAPFNGLLSVAAPTALQVGSLRTGFTLDSARRVALVLAAHNVKIAAHSYSVLDLTNTQMLADVAGTAVTDIANQLFGNLGDDLKVLVGLKAPVNDPTWQPLLVPLPHLLADPVYAVLDYHARVLANRRADYIEILNTLRDLIAPSTFVGSVTGDGTEAKPWVLEVALGIGVAAWTTATTLELGISVEQSLSRVGGGCPTATVRLMARLASIALDGSGGHAIPGASAQFVFAALGGVPLQIGDESAAIVADSAGVELSWSRDQGIKAAVKVPGLSAVVDGETVPVALPTLGNDGKLAGEIPWRAFELLIGHIVNRLRTPWSDRLTRVLGWVPAGGGVTADRLPLEALVQDPVAALRTWAIAQVRHREVIEIAEAIATVVGGPVVDGVTATVMRGRGDARSPLAIPLNFLSATAAQRVELLLWCASPRIPDTRSMPSIDFLAGNVARIDGALRTVAASSRTFEELLRDRDDLSTGLEALATRWTGSDGLVRVEEAALPAARLCDVPNVGHLDLATLDLSRICGVTMDRLTLLVAGASGPDTWNGVEDDHVIDMRAVGLAPEAFDVSPIANADGPWLVLLARRAECAATPDDDGAAKQAARLGRAVDALVSRADTANGEGVTIVAHGAAGHAAAAGAGRTGVLQVVTLGTPHAAIDLSIIETQPGAGALQLLASQVGRSNGDGANTPDSLRGRTLLDAVVQCYENPNDVLDLAPPASAPTIPETVDVYCVRGVFDEDTVMRGVSALATLMVSEDLETELESVPDYVEPSALLGSGLRLAIDPPAEPGALRLSVELSLTGTLFGTASDPGLHIHVGIGRAGGWLAGGPDPARQPGVLRHPSLRRADLEIDLRRSGVASAQLVFHEASALGVERSRWVVDASTAESLLPEAQVLVGRLAAGLGAVPQSGLLRAVAEIFDALGLIDAATPVMTGAPVGLSVDGIRRLMVDPRGLFADAISARNAPNVARALADLLGANAPAASTPTLVQVDVDGVTVGVDVQTLSVEVRATTLALQSGVSITGALQLRADGTFASDIGLALGTATGPNGRPVLDLKFGNDTSLQLRWEGAGSAFAPVALLPTPDVPGLSKLLTTMVPAYVLWAGLSFVRELQPGAVALIDPVLRVAGLLVGTGADEHVVIPLALVADPIHWLTHPDIFGDATGVSDVGRIKGLLDAVAGMVGIPQPAGGGAWQLPFGLDLTAELQNGRAALALDLDRPVADAGLRVGGSVVLILPAGAQPVGAAAVLMLALPGAAAITAASRVELSVGPQALSIHLILPGSNVDLQLIPFTAGLAGLGGAASAAATYALPYVLNTITGLPAAHQLHPIAVALGDVGDALGLRVAGQFDSGQIQALAANPAQQLAQRLSQNLPAAIDALAALIAPATPANYSISRSGNDLLFRDTGALPFEVRVTVPTGGSLQGARLSASLDNVAPFAGATIGASLTIDESGLAEARATFAVNPQQGFDIGPLTLAPIAEIVIGASATGGARVSAGLAIDAARNVSGVLRLAPALSFALEPAGGTLAENVARLLLPPAVDLAMSTSEMTALMDLTVLGGPKVRELLDGVIFAAGVFDAGILDVAQLWARLLKLIDNVASHSPTIAIDALTIKLTARDAAGDRVYGVALDLTPGERFRLVDGDVKVDLEVDSSWVTDKTIAEGLVIEPIRVQGTNLQAFFGISIGGLGLRVLKENEPLIDTFITIDSIALHTLVDVDITGVNAIGGELELGGFAVGLSSSGGDNKVAAGIMKDSASGSEKPEPKFSPGFSAQRYGTGDLRIGLRAGEGDGPWWIRIQRGFGPVYIEQVGFGVTTQNDAVVAARVIVDGKVSMLGLLVAVDDLAVGAHWPQQPSDPALYDPQAWEVDLAGLAVAADMSGVVIAGGLRRSPGALPDYLGMVAIRFSVYGISAYGGYAVVQEGGSQYTSLFLYGAVNAPIGGVPAFFVTGLAAGCGINRKLLLPSDLNEFPSYPLLQALDRSSPMVDPDQALDELRAYFPPARGAFWFAAGLSFNSFSLVDGIVVIAVAIGDGLDIDILGLARAGLPNPSAPMVQIELALVARFSTKDGVLWIQGQLTDNSYLLTRDCRLTGGFAFVMWFKGDKNGEFVITLGGYHPSFHRDGYPVVPRLGFVWTVSSVLVIKGENYFALTSEAIMLGTRFEASLNAGPLWAYMRLGADGIVYFDPFHFLVTAYAEMGAGITIDIDLGWFGHVRITVTVSLHADVLLEGPQFRGRATIDLDVASATIEFGEWSDRSTQVLAWPEFEAKYVTPNDAGMLSVVPGRGVLPPSTADDKKAPTGGATDPFLMLAEFTLSVTTTAATTVLMADGPRNPPFPVVLAVGPMQLSSVTSTLTVKLSQGAQDYVGILDPTPTTGEFPKGAWGPQSQSEPKPIPTGETIAAVNGALLTSGANISPGTVPIDSHQVEIGPRLQLPFLVEAAARGDLQANAEAAAEYAAAQPADAAPVLNTAQQLQTTRPNGPRPSPLGKATFGRARSSPPQLLPLTYRVAVRPRAPVEVPQRPPAKNGKHIDTGTHNPRMEALATVAPTVAKPAPTRTTVGRQADGVTRVTPRTLAEVQASVDPRVAARLLMVAAPSVQQERTIVASARAPNASRAGGGSELRRKVGQTPWKAERLDAASAALLADGVEFVSGELAVFTMDNGHFDIETERPSMEVSGDVAVRVMTMDTMGNVTSDITVLDEHVDVPTQTDRIALLVGGSSTTAGAVGWHAGSRLVQIGARTLVAPGCTIMSTEAVAWRQGSRVSTGFVAPSDVMDGYSIVTTRMPTDVRAVAIILEPLARVDDDRGDVLDLGIAGADRAVEAHGEATPPVIVALGGRRIFVYQLAPADKTASSIDVTVAAGEHLHLGGTLGARVSAQAFAESLSRRDLGSVLGQLVDGTVGATRIRWTPQPTAAR